MPAVAAVATVVVGSALASRAQSKAAGKAAHAQIDASREAEAGIQSRFEQMQELLKPYVQTGTGALSAQGDLAGVNGEQAQQNAVNKISQGSEFATLAGQGETGILQNAAATGGVRGGNTQALLAQFRPQLLSQLINDQYSRLGGLTQVGLGAATGTGNAAMQVGGMAAQLAQDRGAAWAGYELAKGKNAASPHNTAAQLGAMYLGNKGF